MAHFPGHSEEIQKLLEQGNVLGQIASKQSGIAFTPQVLTGADLAQVTQPKITPPTPISTPNIQSIPAEVPVASKTAPVSDFTSQFEESLARLEGLTTTGKTRVETAGSDVQKELIEVNKQIKMRQAEELTFKDIAEKRNVLDPFAVGEAARAQRANAVEVLKLSATAEALQSNFALATRQAERATQLEFAEAQRDLRVKRANILANYDQFTPAQKRRADALLLQIDENDQFVKQQQAERLAIQKVAIEAVRSGVTNNEVLQRIQSSTDLIEANRIAEEAKPPKIETGQSEFERAFFREHGRLPTATELVKRESTGIAGGIVSPDISAVTGKPLTQEERLSQGYANRAVDSHNTINQVGGQFVGPEAIISGSRFFPNILKSSDRQRYEQAQKNFVNAVLRRESGAAIAESEFQNARLQYFPQVGDRPAVIAQKARNRATVIQSLQLAGGKSINNDPLGIR